HCLSHCVVRSRRGREGRRVAALAPDSHARTDRLRDDGGTWAHSRYLVRASQHWPDVRFHHLAHHVSWRDLLPLDPSRTGEDRRLSLAPNPRLDQPARLRQRGDARGVHQRSAHAPLRDLPRHDRLLHRVLVARSAKLPSSGSLLKRYESPSVVRRNELLEASIVTS